jgi:hypothetical protein
MRGFLRTSLVLRQETGMLPPENVTREITATRDETTPADLRFRSVRGAAQGDSTGQSVRSRSY